MSLTSMSARANMAQKLSIPQLQQAIQDGVIPPYVGVPLLQEKVKLAKTAQASQAAQMGAQPNVAQQVMSEAQQVEQGVQSLPTNLPTAMAGGGIVAFAEGGMYDDEDTDEDRLDAARQAEMGELMDEYAQTFQGGIGQLPAAAAAVPAAREGVASGDAADFVAKIMHKESRGRRYGRDGELLTSEKGAKGEMQVMPGTSRDPGFGVKPARDDSPDELARVGRDYAQTLLARYGDPKLAAIAYNMGPGATDKWLAAGADVSKLPRETQGYVRGFAEGGDVAEDYTTIEGMEPSDLYAEAIKRAKAERIKAAVADETPAGRGLWPYNAPEAGKFSYEDAAKYDARKKEEEPKAAPTSKPGITYAPNTGIGNVTPTRYVPKEEPQSEYQKQMSNVGGFFGDVGKGVIGGIGTLGKHLVSAPGYGFSSQKSTEERAPAEVAQNIPSIARGRSTMVNDPRLIGAAQAATQDGGIAKDAGVNARIDKMMTPATATQATAAQVATDPYAEFKDLFAKREAGLAKQREQDKYMALLQAGLGMMGGTSQHALANIGAGGMQGIQSLAQSNAARTAEENALLSGRLGLAKIGGAKEQADAMMQLRRDLAGQTNERLRQTSQEQLALRQGSLEERARKNIEDSLGQMEKLATTQYLAKMKGQVVPGSEDAIKAQALDELRANPRYRKLYMDRYGIDPMEGASATRMSPERAGQFKVER